MAEDSGTTEANGLTELRKLDLGLRELKEAVRDMDPADFEDMDDEFLEEALDELFGPIEPQQGA